MAGSLMKFNTWLNKPDPFSIGTLICKEILLNTPCFYWTIGVNSVLLIPITKNPYWQEDCLNPVSETDRPKPSYFRKDFFNDFLPLLRDNIFPSLLTPSYNNFSLK
jgi:hypothetical protein